MKKRFFLFTAIAFFSMILLAGCKKDKITSGLRLATESYTSDGKAYIDSRHYACWESGDLVKFSHEMDNNSTLHYNATVNINRSSGTPVVTARIDSENEFAPESGVVYGGYPQSTFPSGVGQSQTISMPNHYDYVETSGRQKLTCPMIGMIDVWEQETATTLTFKNVCTLIALTLGDANNANGPAVVSEIKVTAKNGDNYVPMNGAFTLGLTGMNANPSLSPTDRQSVSEADATVTLEFGANAISLAAGQTKTVYIPIPQVSTGCTLIFTVHDALGSGHDITKKIKIGTHDLQPNTYATLNFGDVSTANNEYTFYDWIENLQPHGIDLGVKPTNTSKMEITFSSSCAAENNLDHRPTGASTRVGSSGTHFFAITGGKSSLNWGVSFMNAGQDGRVVAIQNVRVNNRKNRITTTVKESTSQTGWYYADIVYENLNGNNYIQAQTSPVSGGLQNPTNIYVFAAGGNSENTEPAGMKLYSYRVWSDYTTDNSLQCNFVPCVHHIYNESNEETGTELGVYNMVRGTFIKCDDANVVGGTIGNIFKVGNN